MLLHIINAFVHAYWDTIDGRLSSASATAELYGGYPYYRQALSFSPFLRALSYTGARINYIFHDLFGTYVDGIDALGGLTDEEVQVIMANATVPFPTARGSVWVGVRVRFRGRVKVPL